jgi:hypothetical protein
MNNPFTMFAVAAAPFVAPTNEVSTNTSAALNALAYHANALDVKLADTDSRVSIMQHQVKHLESGFLVVVFLLVVLLLMLCMRNAKRTTRVITPETLSPLEDQKAVIPTVAEEKKP